MSGERISWSARRVNPVIGGGLRRLSEVADWKAKRNTSPAPPPEPTAAGGDEDATDQAQTPKPRPPQSF